MFIHDCTRCTTIHNCKDIKSSPDLELFPPTTHALRNAREITTPLVVRNRNNKLMSTSFPFFSQWRKLFGQAPPDEMQKKGSQNPPIFNKRK